MRSIWFVLLCSCSAEVASSGEPASVRDRLVSEVEAGYQAKLDAMRAEYEAKLAELPRTLARRMAETLLRGGGGKSVGDLMASLSKPGDLAGIAM